MPKSWARVKPSARSTANSLPSSSWIAMSALRMATKAMITANSLRTLVMVNVRSNTSMVSLRMLAASLMSSAWSSLEAISKRRRSSPTSLSGAA